MKIQIILLIVTVLVVLSSCRRRKHGNKRKSYTEDGEKRGFIESKSRHKLHKMLTKGATWNAEPEKRSKYSTSFLDQYTPHIKETDDYDKEIVANYATENTPLFWKDVDDNKGLKKEDEELPPVGFQQQEDELPSTVGPNENIYGGFPINDVLGGFELPSPETLAVLKLALKQHGPRNDYEAKLHHDLENWAYGYEHHALPEYDIKETPPFYVTMLEGLKMLQENKKKPASACNAGKAGCGPMVQLTDDQCNTLAGNCMQSKPVTSQGFEKPCPWKIIEMLYGCKRPKAPAVNEKPDSVEPPPPKPDKPEQPVQEQPEKSEDPKPTKPEEPMPVKSEEQNPSKPEDHKPVEPAPDKALEKEEPNKKPKPIPIEFPTIHENKLAPDIKNDDSSVRATDASKPNEKLQQELGILGMLSDHGSPKNEPMNPTSVTETPVSATNISTTENKNETQTPDISLEVDSGQTPAVMESELTTKGKPEPAKAPLDTEFSTWTDWSQCSVTCGKGSLSRTRSCLNWKCDGKVIDLLPCFMPQCPEYLEWSGWSPCDSMCGKGRAVRTRKCSGVRCSGISTEEKTCYRDQCKPKAANPKQIISNKLIKSVGAPWANWSPCTAKCGFGVQIRKRNCKQGNCAINSDLVQTKACLKQACKTNIAPDILPKNVQQACLYIHNSYRLPHGADELHWSDYLGEAATKLARDLAQNSTTGAQVRQYEVPGTSIMVLPIGDSSDVGVEAACVTSAKAWYDEQKKYNFSQPQLTDSNRHFTQMIWKASKNVGLGTAQSPSNGKFYFVAMYEPPGNQDSYVGFRKNALPLQMKSTGDGSTEIVRRTD